MEIQILQRIFPTGGSIWDFFVIDTLYELYCRVKWAFTVLISAPSISHILCTYLITPEEHPKIYLWPEKRKRTLTLYRLTVETVYYPFSIRLKMVSVKRLNTFLIRL